MDINTYLFGLHIQDAKTLVSLLEHHHRIQCRDEQPLHEDTIRDLLTSLDETITKLKNT